MGLPGIQQAGTAIYRRVAASRTCSLLDRTGADGENCLFASARPIARSLTLAGLGIMVVLGLLHVVDTWPLSCFPPFDGPTSDTIAQLCVQTTDTRGVAQEWNLGADPKLRAAYRRWQWLTIQGMQAPSAARPKAAAVVNLWLRYHPELHVKKVIVFRDIYQMRPLEGSRVRVTRQKKLGIRVLMNS
jgi:hypothetical protein